VKPVCNVSLAHYLPASPACDNGETRVKRFPKHTNNIGATIGKRFSDLADLDSDFRHSRYAVAKPNTN